MLGSQPQHGEEEPDQSQPGQLDDDGRPHQPHWTFHERLAMLPGKDPRPAKIANRSLAQR